jgi:hypothetical protein
MNDNGGTPMNDNPRTGSVTFEVGSCTNPWCPVHVEEGAYELRRVELPEVVPGVVQGHGFSCSGCGQVLISRLALGPRDATSAVAGSADSGRGLA